MISLSKAFKILIAPMSPISNKDEKPLTFARVALKFSVTVREVKLIRAGRYHETIVNKGQGEFNFD